jgi:hypothetical protein
MGFNLNLSKVKEPELLDSGEWEFRVISSRYTENPEHDDTDKSDNPKNYKGRINVRTVPVQPIDVMPETEDWRGRTTDKTFFIRGTGGYERDLLELRKLVEAMGVDVEEHGDGEPEDLCGRLKDRRFIASVGKYSGKRGVENTLSGYRPVE